MALMAVQKLDITWENVFEATSQFAELKNVTDKVNLAPTGLYEYGPIETYRLKIRITHVPVTGTRTPCFLWCVNNEIFGMTFQTVFRTYQSKTGYYDTTGITELEFACLGGIMSVSMLIGKEKRVAGVRYFEADKIKSIVFTAGEIGVSAENLNVEVFALPA